MVLPAAQVPQQIQDPDDDEPGLISRWIRRDRVRAVAVLLIVFHLIWRGYIGSQGFLFFDDFFIAIYSVDGELTSQFLFSHVNNHMFPLPLLFTRFVTENLGFAFWPYLTVMLVCQALLNISFYRLLRQLLPAGYGLLIPFSIFLFTPLNLEATSWWSFGMLMLPMQLAMVWSAGALLKYSRDRHYRHLATIPLAVLFGLACAPKALLTIPFLFGFAACFLVRGSVGRSIWRTIKGFWPVWLILTVIAVTYSMAYFGDAGSSLRTPRSSGQVITFFGQLFGQTLVPGLAGGPWSWLGVEGSPITAPSQVLQMLSMIVLLLVIVFTVWRRPAAGRAWVLAIGYAFAAAGMIAATRMGDTIWSDLAGLVTRYAVDIAMVASLCLGVAVFGLKDLPDRKQPRQLPFQSPGTVVVAGALTAILFAYGAVVSTAGFTQIWSHQPGRDFLATAEAELAKMPQGTVFLDAPMPFAVMATATHNKTSLFFGAHKPLTRKPVFVTSGENPNVFDDTGKIRPAWVEGAELKKGPDGDCGYFVGGGETKQLPLVMPMFEWEWWLRVGYLSQGETDITVQLGNARHTFKAKPGLNQMFFPLLAKGDTVVVTSAAPSVGVCINSITVGKLKPWLF